MSITSKIRDWFAQQPDTPKKIALQILALVLGGNTVMALGLAIFGVILFSTPLLTFALPIFVLGYILAWVWAYYRKK
ncbi:MAG: hypothetical protein ACOVS5_01795 [Oligoflexus sp.]|jgi:hypothetical protein